MNDVYKVYQLKEKFSSLNHALYGPPLKILITFRYGFGFLKNGAMRCIYHIFETLKNKGHKITLVFDNQFKYFNENLNSNQDYDLFIVNHAEHFKSLNIETKGKPIIHLVHSEFFDIDKPLVGYENIKYIAVRTEIKDYLINHYSIDESSISIVLNPIDINKFNPFVTEADKEITKQMGLNKFGLFAGTFMYLREKPCINFAMLCKSKNITSVYAGELVNNKNLQLLERHFDLVLPFNDKVESLFKMAQITGGIQKGRTYWEGKLCKKTVFEFMVEPNGEIYDLLIEKGSDSDADLVKKIVEPTFVTELILDLALSSL
jgi:hypothetical protein